MDGTRTEGGKGKAEQEEGLFQQYILRRNARVYRLTDSSCLPDTQAKPTPVVCIGQPLQEIGTPHQPFQIFSESRINGGTPYRRNQSPSGDRIFGDFSLYRDVVKYAPSIGGWYIRAFQRSFQSRVAVAGNAVVLTMLIFLNFIRVLTLTRVYPIPHFHLFFNVFFLLRLLKFQTYLCACRIRGKFRSRYVT